jgi:hypothetical protein
MPLERLACAMTEGVSMISRSMVYLAAAAILAACASGGAAALHGVGAPAVTTPPRADGPAPSAGAAVEKDVPYVPTPQETVEEMLRMAKVSRRDLLYDLGSGDGRIVITAAKEFGARGVGIDIDPQRIAEANQNARATGVTHRVKFIQGDLFDTDLRDATAVTLYLLPAVNLRLRPKLLAELRPGTPVVSHDFDMDEWEPDHQQRVGDDLLYLWIVPARVEGSWSWTTPEGERRNGVLRQRFQKLDGRVEGGGAELALANARVNGHEVTFELTRGSGAEPLVVERYRGRVKRRSITGTAQAGDRRWKWRARPGRPAEPGESTR